MLRVHENLYRDDVDIVDEAVFMRGAIAELGLSVAEFAEQVGRSVQYVRDRLDLLLFDEAVQESVRSKMISFSVAKWIARIEDLDTRHWYLEYAVKNGVSAIVAQTWYEASKVGQLQPAEESAQAASAGVQRPQRIWTVPCRICAASVRQEEARMFLAHQSCIDLLDRVKVGAGEAAPAGGENA